MTKIVKVNFNCKTCISCGDNLTRKQVCEYALNKKPQLCVFCSEENPEDTDPLKAA